MRLKRIGATIIVGGFLVVGFALRLLPDNLWLHKFGPLTAFGFMVVGAFIGIAGMVQAASQRRRNLGDTRRFGPETFGILSIVLFVVCWLSAATPNLVEPGSRFAPLVVATSLTALAGSLVTSLLAGIRGSKWWLLTLIGPGLGLVILWSSRV